jgi:broad specificity phosphatase PhoE
MSEAGISGSIEEDGRIFIVRHAESAANASGRTGDPATIPITETGARQAQQIANVIPARPAVIVVSRYLRTIQTATPLLKRYPGVPVERWPVEEFTYLDIAVCAGTTYAEREGFRDAYWGRCDPLWTDGPGCESFTDFVARVRRFEQALSVRGADETVVAYSHGLIMQALLWLQQHSSGNTDRVAMQDFDRVRRSVLVPNCAILRAATNGSGHIRISPKVTVPRIPKDRN